MEKTIDNSYIVTTFFVSLLGFVILSILRRRSSNLVSQSKKINNRSKLTRGEVRRSENDDVIIVGAGVSGAALAYTLGKVRFCFLYFIKS